MSDAAAVLRMPESPEAEFPPFLEKAPFGLALIRENGNIKAVNPVLQQMLGAAILPSHKYPDLIQAEDRSETERLVSGLFEGQRDSFQIDSKTPGPNGRSLRWTVWRVQGDDGSTEAVLAMAEELGEATAAEQRLRQAQRLEVVGRLAGGVAHDFNNLLTGVLLYCDLLIASLEPGHRARTYAEEIRKAGFQATGIVRQLLAVARPTNSQPRLLSLNEIAEGMRNLLVRLIGENIELRFNLDPKLGLVKIDPSQAQQILLNLVLNARDAMPQGGRIAINTSNSNVQVLPDPAAGICDSATLPCALFVVSDNGHGMDESARAHLFEPFFTTKGGKGTGLGLSTVRDIVTNNGGLIFVESKTGEGARISVLIPLVWQEGRTFTCQESHFPGNGQLSSQEKE